MRNQNNSLLNRDPSDWTTPRPSTANQHHHHRHGRPQPPRPRLRQRPHAPRLQPEMGNLIICNQKLIETISLPITIGNWHYSRIRVVGSVVDSVTESRKTQLQLLFIMT